MKKLFLLIIFLIANYGNSQIISEELVKKHLYTLSDDDMEGRRAGTKGIEKAAKYIESSSLFAKGIFKSWCTLGFLKWQT